MDKKFEKSQFILRVYLHEKNPATGKDRMATYPSFPNKDRFGAEFQFETMQDRLLNKKHNGNFKTALFIETASDRVLKKVNGTK
ncbi:MAG: hypothetical protein EOM76_07200 [Sphingobacteriia bacterium]|nr:hypothetical protein [Sphingobacteriia bacterium]